MSAGGRGWDEVLADAVRVLTEAARLRHPVPREEEDGLVPAPDRTEPADWAEFVTLAVAGAAANVGSIGRALAARPGSWETAAVRALLASTAGPGGEFLAEHRTEPIRVVLRPTEILASLGYDRLYDDSRQVLWDQANPHQWRYRLGEDGVWTALDPGAPAPDLPAASDPALSLGTVVAVPRSSEDQVALDALGAQEAALDDLEFETDPRVYAQALKPVVLALAGRRYPGIPVQVTLSTEMRSWVRDDRCWGEVPEETLTDDAVEVTPLPWSGIAPRDYPAGDIAGTERAAGRLPHLRLPRTWSEPKHRS